MQILDAVWFACRVGLELAILSSLFYSLLIFLKGTRSVTILAGFGALALLLTTLAQVMDLEIIRWLLSKLWAVMTISVLIIFQPEIRRAFAELGSQQIRLRSVMSSRQERATVETLVTACFAMARQRIGALIAVEREIGMRAFAESGTFINAPVSSELLRTIFFPNTPLHDGGVIIRHNTIVAAGCIFPLTDNLEMSRELGTRHRAGVGITEEPDAVAIIVSEETGAVSIAFRGRLVQNVDAKRLRRHLINYLVKAKQVKKVPVERPAEIPADAISQEAPAS